MARSDGKGMEFITCHTVETEPPCLDVSTESKQPTGGDLQSA